MNEEQTFLQYCGLTCMGGSEKRGCQCSHPEGCEKKNDPRFSHWRFKAEERMTRHMRNAITGDSALARHFRSVLEPCADQEKKP